MPSNARWLRDRESEMLTRDRHSESERGCVSVEERGCYYAAFESKHGCMRERERERERGCCCVVLESERGCMRERGATVVLYLRVRVVA